MYQENSTESEDDFTAENHEITSHSQPGIGVLVRKEYKRRIKCEKEKNGDKVTSQHKNSNKEFASSFAMLPVFPENLNWNEAREKWLTWKKLFERALELKCFGKSQREKETILLMRGGNMIQDIAFNQQPAPGETLEVGTEQEMPVFDNLLKRCEYYFTINSHVVIDVERFRNIKQKEGESFCTFVANLRRLATLCSFGGNVEQEIKMQIMHGAQDRQFLIQQGICQDKSLAEIEAIGVRLEMTRSMFPQPDTSEVKKEPENKEELNAIQSHRHKDDNRAGGKWSARPQSNRGWQSDRGRDHRYQSNGNQYTNENGSKCGQCGMNHRPRDCSAYGKRCHNCGKMNHFESVCRQKRINFVNNEHEDAQVKRDY